MIEESPKGVFYFVLGLAVVIGFIVYCSKSNPSTHFNESPDELYNKKVYTGTYSATVKGTHEYRRDTNGHVYTRNDTTTIIE